MMKKILVRLFRSFRDGLVLIVPISCTILFILYIVSKFREFLLMVITHIPYLARAADFPTFTFLLTLLAVCLVGWLASSPVGKITFQPFRRLMLSTPGMGIWYSYFEESAAAMLGKFNKPVLVHTSEGDKVGFLTQEDLNNLGLKDKVAVYLPYAYSLAGKTIIVLRQQVEVLKGISSTDAYRFAITGGLAEIKQSLIVQK